MSRSRTLLTVAVLVVLLLRVPAAAQNQTSRSLSVLAPTLVRIYERHLNGARVAPEALLRAALAALERHIADVYITPHATQRSLVVHVGSHQTEVDIALDQFGLWVVHKRLNPILNFIHQHTRERVGRDELEYLAVNGILQSLDDHSTSMLHKMPGPRWSTGVDASPLAFRFP